MKVRLYYHRQLIQEWEVNDFFFLLGRGAEKSISTQVYEMGIEYYNGGYLWLGDLKAPPLWRRCDMTPVLLEDVPKELRLLDLVLGD